MGHVRIVAVHGRLRAVTQAYLAYCSGKGAPPTATQIEMQALNREMVGLAAQLGQPRR